MGGFSSSSNSSYYQGGFLSEELVMKAEECGLSLEKIKDLSLKELSFFMRREESANTIKKYATYIPILSINYTFHPISSTIAKVTLEFSVDFT
jgi:Sec63 Brl domain.